MRRKHYKQAFQDYELILVDDGSTDGSGNLCDELAQKNNKIQVIHKENEGQNSARDPAVVKKFRNMSKEKK